MRTALVFGGAFNPPTIAHVSLAEYAMRKTGFDHVIFLPTKNTYIEDVQKKEYVFSDEERIDMLQKIAANRPWMIVSTYEIEAEQQPRTYQSLCHFRDEGWKVSLLFGSDKLPELQNGWKFVDEICREFGIVCMKRSTDHPEELLAGDLYLRTLSEYIQILDTPDVTKDVSSTAIRQLLSDMRSDYAALKQQLPDELHPLIMKFLEKGDTE